jgi:serine protease Do
MFKISKKILLIAAFSVNIFIGILIGTIYYYKNANPLAGFISGEEYMSPKRIEETELSALSLQKIFNKIAKMNIPAVVGLHVETLTVEQNRGFGFFGDDEFLRRFFGLPPEKSRRRGRSFGSGFVISKDGYLISNHHVVDGAVRIIVVFKDSDKEYEAEIVGTDPNADIALLKIKHGGNYPFVLLGDSETVEVGDIVAAIGNPFGLQSTFTTGVISAKGRRGIGNKYENFLQTDVAINQGNSGGPLINIHGEVIGINSMIYSQSGGSIGIGFAIPINMVKTIVAQLKKTGKVTRGYLGVKVQDISAQMAKDLEISKNGVYIPEVVKKSPAEKGGIKAGDIILSFNNKKVKNASDLLNFVGLVPPGTKVAVELMRGREKKTITVEIESEDNAEKYEDVSVSGKYLGITVSNMTDDFLENYNTDEPFGVIVTELEDSSPFIQKGLRPGDIVRSINYNEITSVKTYNALMEKCIDDRKIIFHIQRGSYLYPVVIRS